MGRQWLKAGTEISTDQDVLNASTKRGYTGTDEHCHPAELQCEIVDVDSPAEEPNGTSSAITGGILPQVRCPVCNALLAAEDADAHVNGHFEAEPSPSTQQTKAAVLEHGPGRPKVPIAESLPEPAPASCPNKRKKQSTLDFIGGNVSKVQATVSSVASRSTHDVE